MDLCGLLVCNDKIWCENGSNYTFYIFLPFVIKGEPKLGLHVLRILFERSQFNISVKEEKKSENETLNIGKSLQGMVKWNQ